MFFFLSAAVRRHATREEAEGAARAKVVRGPTGPSFHSPLDYPRGSLRGRIRRFINHSLYLIEPRQSRARCVWFRSADFIWTPVAAAAAAAAPTAESAPSISRARCEKQVVWVIWERWFSRAARSAPYWLRLVVFLVGFCLGSLSARRPWNIFGNNSRSWLHLIAG